MVYRRLHQTVSDKLARFPAVALLGPRQAGKTTLACTVAGGRPSVYIDLENPRDLAGLTQDVVRRLEEREDRLVVLDEVSRTPGLFRALRGLIDRGRRRGLRAGRFLILGSAERLLLGQTDESLAGRIAYLDFGPFDALETDGERMDRLWLRGGFPKSFLAAGDEESMAWRERFIADFLGRDIPAMGPRIPMLALYRFWMDLALNQGGPRNAARAARELSVDGKTVARHLDIFIDLMMVRHVHPHPVGARRRLARSPKTYIRDSGLLHALLRIPDAKTLLDHPMAEASWKGFVTENLLSVVPKRTLSTFYRAGAGAEIDLVLDFPGFPKRRWAIGMRLGRNPEEPSKGFYSAIEDVKPDRAFVVCRAEGRRRISDKVEATDLPGLMRLLARCGRRPAPQ